MLLIGKCVAPTLLVRKVPVISVLSVNTYYIHMPLIELKLLEKYRLCDNYKYYQWQTIYQYTVGMTIASNKNITCMKLVLILWRKW